MKLSLLYSAISVIFFTASAGQTFAGDACLQCHEKETPGIVQYWKNSMHFKKQVSCAGCHGSNIEANHQRTVSVDAKKCGTCHARALVDHGSSKHGISLKAGRGCTRNQKETDEQKKSCALCHKPGSSEPLVAVECAMYLAQSPAMQRQGCGACHLVETRCDTCHTLHGTDLQVARNPGTCGTCHMGPDHPQVEAWETSRHGVLFKQGGEHSAPSCVTCHMPSGTHNVSRGIALGALERKKQEREQMLVICAACHSKAFAKRNLDDADRIYEESSALVAEARTIIEGLHAEGLLYPPLSQRPEHPLFGRSLEIGPHMLYENLSLVESFFFKMKAFYAATAYKGAYHQNPDYAHWFGNAPLKLTLSEIKSEAALLREVNRLKQRLDNIGHSGLEQSGEFSILKKNLRTLNEKKLTSEISEQDYQVRKKKLLDEQGLK